VTFQLHQSAPIAHARLQAAVQAMDRAERCAVLWFADIDRRALYRDLGYASMPQYAVEALGFSKTRTNDFLRLARRLDDLPAVKASVAAGELGYTKAREIVKVASPRTERLWLEDAQALNRRDLERKVARVKAKARRRSNAAQIEMLPPPPEAPLAADVPVRVSVTMTAEQAARYRSLWEQLGRAPNAEDLLAALAGLAEGTSNDATACEERRSAKSTPRGVRPPVQIHVHRCPDCDSMVVDGRTLDRADRERVACDAAVAAPGGRNTTTIPPRVRREVLARDRHRCRAPGCDHTRFLEVHHVVPRSCGGTNDATNLVTLCSACHRLVHERRTSAWIQGAAG